MKTYDDYVKELLVPLLKNHYLESKDLSTFDSIFDFLPRAIKDEICIFIEELLPEEGEEESRRNGPRLIRKRKSNAVTSLLEDAMDSEVDRDLVFEFLISKIESAKLNITHYENFSAQLNQIQEFFGLNDLNIKVLLFFFMIEDEDDKWGDIVSKRKSKNILIKNYHLFHPSKSEVLLALSEKSPLHYCGLLTKCRIESYDIAPSILDFFRGVGSSEFCDGILTSSPKELLPISAFHIEAKQSEAIKKLLTFDLPVNILFAGTPGTGKTSLAFSLINELGLEPIYLKHDIEEDDDRRLNLYAARRYAAQSGRVLIIDEADDIISHKRSFFFGNSNQDTDKAWINFFLDSNKAKTIFITNDTSRIEDSTSRRFNYVLNFLPLNFLQRRNIWMNVILKYQQQWISELPEFENLVRSYNLDAGSIDDAVLRIAKIGRNFDFLLHYLDQKMEFLHGESVKREDLKSTYKLEALNLSHTPDLIIDKLRKFERLEKNKAGNFNLLFQGASGTGKTELVKYLADKLNKPLIVKTVSDISSKWVGEAEKNLAKAFKEAEAQEALLFFDEADSFFQAREGAHRNWEITQVNELLVQMERFKGIFICSTNFLKHFDKAALRRFQLKVSFNCLNENGKKLLLESYFPDLSSEKMLSALERVSNLTPGDFKNVSRNLSYEDKFDEEDVVRELLLEVSYKGERTQVRLV